TYNKILNDSRHENALLLQYQEIDRRDFSEWSMAYLPEASKLAPLIKTYSRSEILEPYNMSGESCHQLLIALKVMMS
ncbi:MAG: BLUF domain-containing protein, partial [Deefgea sp.]